MKVSKRSLASNVTADYLQIETHRRLLFEGAPAGYKRDVYSDSVAPAQFVCLNALVASNAARTMSNIATRRNFLVEFDTLQTIGQQERLFEKGGALPFLTKVYSGKKSLHYVIGVDEALDDESYRVVFTMLSWYFNNKNDTSCINANRLTRTGGAVREDTGVRQELLATGRRVPLQTLTTALAANDPRAYNVALEQTLERFRRIKAAPTRDVSEDAQMPRWVEMLLLTGEYIGSSRHEVLKAATTALYKAGFSEERAELVLYQLQDKLAINDRDDVPGLLRWASLNLRR